jgi:hypothetical protein
LENDINDFIMGLKIGDIFEIEPGTILYDFKDSELRDLEGAVTDSVFGSNLFQLQAWGLIDINIALGTTIPLTLPHEGQALGALDINELLDLAIALLSLIS